MTPVTTGAVCGVVFDLNGVLLRYATHDGFAALARTAGVDDVADFHHEYWRQREAYDSARMTSEQYWQILGQRFARTYAVEQIDRLIRADAAMWSEPNKPMIEALRRLAHGGTRVAILSNVPRDLWRLISRRHPWTTEANITTLSHDVGLTKPDRAIFRICLAELQRSPSQTVLIDDTAANVAAARELGIAAWLWTPHTEEEIVDRLEGVTSSKSQVVRACPDAPGPARESSLRPNPSYCEVRTR